MKSRRFFLQKAGLSALALNLTPFNPISAMTQDIFNSKQDEKQDEKPLRVAIMGLGSYGTRVANAMKDCKRAKLVGVISGTPSKIEAWQKEYGIPAKNCYNYETYHQIKDNPDIDAVYVITPNGLHMEHTMGVAKAER